MSLTLSYARPAFGIVAGDLRTTRPGGYEDEATKLVPWPGGWAATAGWIPLSRFVRRRIMQTPATNATGLDAALRDEHATRWGNLSQLVPAGHDPIAVAHVVGRGLDGPWAAEIGVPDGIYTGPWAIAAPTGLDEREWAELWRPFRRALDDATDLVGALRAVGAYAAAVAEATPHCSPDIEVGVLDRHGFRWHTKTRADTLAHHTEAARFRARPAPLPSPPTEEEVWLSIDSPRR